MWYNKLTDELTDEYEKIGRQATYTTAQNYNDGEVECSFTHYEGADYEEDGYDGTRRRRRRR